MFKRARTQKSRGRGSNFPLIAESTISFWGLSKTRTSLKKSDGFPFPDCTEPPSEVAGGCGGHPNHSFFPFLKNSLERVGIVLAQVGGAHPYLLASKGDRERRASDMVEVLKRWEGASLRLWRYRRR
jgi:hypothetical protein